MAYIPRSRNVKTTLPIKLLNRHEHRAIINKLHCVPPPFSLPRASALRSQTERVGLDQSSGFHQITDLDVSCFYRVKPDKANPGLLIFWATCPDFRGLFLTTSATFIVHFIGHGVSQYSHVYHACY